MHPFFFLFLHQPPPYLNQLFPPFPNPPPLHPPSPRHRCINLFFLAYQRFWIEAEEYFFEEKLVQDLAVSTRSPVAGGGGLVGSARHVERPAGAMPVERLALLPQPRRVAFCPGAVAASWLARQFPRLARRGPHERVVRDIPSAQLTASKAVFSHTLVRGY